MREIELIERIESDPNHRKPSPPFKSSRTLSLLRFPLASSILRCSVQFRRCEYPELRDQDKQIEQLKKCEPLKESKVKALCLKTMKILVEESNIQRVSCRIEVCKERIERRKAIESGEFSAIFGFSGNGLVRTSLGSFGRRTYGLGVSVN